MFNEQKTQAAVENGYMEVVFGQVASRQVVTVRVANTGETFTGEVE